MASPELRAEATPVPRLPRVSSAAPAASLAQGLVRAEWGPQPLAVILWANQKKNDFGRAPLGARFLIFLLLW